MSWVFKDEIRGFVSPLERFEITLDFVVEKSTKSKNRSSSSFFGLGMCPPPSLNPEKKSKKNTKRSKNNSKLIVDVQVFRNQLGGWFHLKDFYDRCGFH